ncbi:MAG: phosphoribosyl-AMP cyclohydrolase [Candidatus Omnitrophica bacterium]|nr:phosphoribosyl-AMP cyclohydrolase [Candidatus Omnitrophota bacterium]
MNRKDYKGEASSKVLEDGNDLLIDFEKLKKVAQSPDSVVPVVVQDAASKEVLIVAYANEKALRHTLESGLATFWSTSRNELWIKGKTSGDELYIVDVFVNCEQNSLLYLVTMKAKGSCHTKDTKGQTRFGCYYRRIKNGKLEFIK